MSARSATHGDEEGEPLAAQSGQKSGQKHSSCLQYLELKVTNIISIKRHRYINCCTRRY